MESGGGGGGGPLSSSSLFSPTGSSSSSSSSLKRRHYSSSGSSSFKQQQPPQQHTPMKFPGNETVFRILCPAEKTGGVIGKGGSIVRQFREETGARIRVEDTIHRSDDRVISIVGEGHARKRREIGNGGDGIEDNLSPAQRALVRVFERILQVEGDAVVTGEDNDIQGLVACRLLAPITQVGCVLGKGGKIVEKIRHETGAQIRVLSMEQVPACAAPGDELIHISGSFSAVKKAVIAVSGCLQDNPRTTDPSNYLPAKLMGSASTVHMERFPQRSFSSGHHPAEYHSRGYSSHLGIDLHPASGQRKFIEEDMLFRVLCTNDKVGSIIGKGGSIIRALQVDTGASIKIVDAIPDSEERVIAISSRESTEFQHSPAQEAVLRVYSRLAEAGVEKTSSASARLLVPSQQVGCLMGKGGNIISEMRRATGANIRIFLKQQAPKCAQPNDEVVQINGSFQSVYDALYHITGRIRELTFSAKSQGMGSGQYLSATHDAPPSLTRSKSELTSSGVYSTSGFSHGLDRFSRLGHGQSQSQMVDWQSTRSRSLERVGVSSADRVAYFHGSEMGSGGSHREVPDAGSGMTSRSAGPGREVQAVTVEVSIPLKYLGHIQGEHSNNLVKIREISGAKVAVNDPQAGSGEATASISGAPEQIHVAQSLLHGFILAGHWQLEVAG